MGDNVEVVLISVGVVLVLMVGGAVGYFLYNRQQKIRLQNQIQNLILEERNHRVNGAAAYRNYQDKIMNEDQTMATSLYLGTGSSDMPVLNFNSDMSSDQFLLYQHSITITKQKSPKKRPFFEQDEVLKEMRLDGSNMFTTRIISQGEFGVVYLAQYIAQAVAVKRMRDDEEEIKRSDIQQFVEEIKKRGRLSHPKIVQFMGVVWTCELDIGIVMEYMERGNLRHFLEKKDSTRTWKNTYLSIAIDIAEALAYLHKLAPVVIHRDVRAKNVLLTKNMVGKLSDFGLSAQYFDETRTMGVGTLRWTAPEVLLGEKYDAAADIYSFGIFLSELQTGDIPFDYCGKHIDEATIAFDVIKGVLKPNFGKNCPSSLQKLADSCLQSDPSKRPCAEKLLEILSNTVYSEINDL